MPCGCSKTGTAPTTKSAARKDGPLACARCLEKHLCKAFVYSAEAQEDARPVESGLCAANLEAAREHAVALGDPRAAVFPKLADDPGAIPTPEKIAALFPSGIPWKEKAIGYMGAAEDALRAIGRAGEADAIRKIRIRFSEDEP